MSQIGHSGVPFYSKRLTFRDHIGDDLPGFHRWLSDPSVMEMVGFDATTSVERSQERLEEIIRSQSSADRTDYFFAVVESDTDIYVGDTGLTVLDRRTDGGVGELGYFLIPEYQGRGFGTEMASAVIRFGFRELGLHRIIACCDARNVASERVMRAAGMTREACRRLSRYKDGEWHDELEYAILRER